MILERVHQIEDLNVLFIESICTDKKVAHDLLCRADSVQILENNMRLKLSGPDYKGIVYCRYSLTNRHGPRRGSGGFQTTHYELRESL
jgi:hypothetical protein